MSNKWFSQLMKEDKKFKKASEIKDIRESMVVMDSPSLNYATYGGLPRGKISVFYGPEGSSKSTLAMMALAKIQQADPEALGLWFDAELSFSPAWAQKQGVDLDRLLIRQGNNGPEIFDFLSRTIKAQIQDGANYQFACIDSIKALVPPKEAAQESTGNHQIGDLSKFLNIALRSVVETVYDSNMTMILINQANINMDPNTGKYQPFIQAGGMSIRHAASLVCLVEKIKSKDSRIFDESVSNMNDTAELVGSKIRVKVEKSRAGGEGRVAEFSLHYSKGIINIGEEVAKLGINQAVIQRPNNMTYLLPSGQKFVGGKNLIQHLEQNPEARQEVMDALYAKKSSELPTEVGDE